MLTLLQSAVAWVVVLSLCGVGCLLAGVYTLAGTGWTLVGGGLVCLVGANVLRMGVIAHG